MLKRLSGYPDDRLAYLLARVREISALGDEAALIETDKFAWEIMDGEFEGVEADVAPVHDTFEYYQEHRMRRLEISLKDLRGKLASKTLGRWDLSRFDNGLRFDLHIQNENQYTGDTWDQFRQESSAFLDEAWQFVAFETLDECAALQFKSIASVVSMMSNLNQTIEMYIKHKPLTEDISLRIREVKERGARFRWAKKNSDAEVARVSGFIGKAEGLRREALALLAQDWAMVFDGEKVPEVNTTQ